MVCMDYQAGVGEREKFDSQEEVVELHWLGVRDDVECHGKMKVLGVM